MHRLKGPTAMIVSLDLFLETLLRSRLLPEETVAAETARFRASRAARQDAKAFAEALCRRRLLTVWQAQNLLAGKHRGYSVGSYTLLGMVARGGMSFVYLAEHRLLKRRCAIKVLPAARAANPALLARFHREARAAATLDHPNVVRMLDAGELAEGASTIHYLVMEYVAGTTLFEVVRQSGRMPVAKAVDAIRQAARGLQHVHDAGLVHRDIKPENLIVDARGTVRLMDLGLAKFNESDEEQLTIQQEGRVLGTANYCAPEQAIDSHGVDSRADIYGLGCTLYFLLAGRPPFHEGSLAQRLLSHQNRQPIAIETLRSDLPPALCALLRRMLAKSPADRIATAGEVADELDRIAGQLAGPARGVAAAATGKPENELCDAIAKVSSVERAVAMLRVDLPQGPSSANRPASRRLQATASRELRSRRRTDRGRRLAGALSLAFAILIATLATWSSPGIVAGSRPMLAESRPPSVETPAPIDLPVPAPLRPAPRAIVVQGGDGLRADLIRPL